MIQRGKSQKIGLWVIVVFSAVFLSVLTAVAWPVPVVYADGPPEILTITVTSSLGTYFHDPGLESSGGMVYFNSLAGEGGGQVLTVTTIVSGSTPITLTGATAFDMTPIPDTSSSGELGITYTVGIGADTENGVLFTVTDSGGFTDTAVITFTRDNVTPTVEFTDVTDPDYDSSDPLNERDDDGSNWYDPDNLSAGWHFTSTVTDTLSGLALANASWDHSNDADDQLVYDPGLDGDGVFSGVDDDGDGVVTVTLTMTDNVGNSSSDLVVLNLDDTDPNIISPTLYEYSNFLHTPDGSMLYYGDDMATAVVFSVEGEAQDDGAGPYQTTYSQAFGGTPSDDLLESPPYSWEGYYNVDNLEDWGSGTITVTVSDQVGNSATQIFAYAGDLISPTIVPITIAESSPYLHADGLTLYYSNMMGGSAQDFEVQGTASDEGGAGFRDVVFSVAFGDSLDPDGNSPWSGVYDVISSNSGDDNITVTAYDNVSNWSTGVFTYIEDTITPTVVITDVTDPGYDSAGNELDDDGSNWYNAGDFPSGNWTFISDTSDDGAGLASGSAFWDHSNDVYDHTIDCGPDGDGTFLGVSSDGDGTATVTVTITDNVGNSASDAVVFNIDNTEPTITSPYIDDFGYTHLHVVDDITIYYGDDMAGPEVFRVQGNAQDTGGVGLHYVAYSAALGEPYVEDYSNLASWRRDYTAEQSDTTSGVITAAVYDWLGNFATQVFTYTHDTDSPTSAASSPQYEDGNPIVVTYTNAIDPGGSGLQWVQLWYKEEVSGTWANSGLPAQTGPSGSFNFIPTGDGTYYFASVATDNVGNGEDTPTDTGDDETIYDTIKPSRPENLRHLDDTTDSGSDGFLPEAGYYDDPVIKLEWDPSTDGGSGLLTPPYHLGTAPHPTDGSYEWNSPYTVTIGVSGVYSIYLTAEDNAGNISDDAVTEEPVVVDIEYPQVDVDCPTDTGDFSFVVDWSATTDQGPSGLRSTDPYSVSYRVDGGDWQDWITATSAVTATFGPDSPVTVEYSHTYCFRMRAVDKAGNVAYTDGGACTEVSEAYGPAVEKVFLPLVIAPDPNWGFELGNFTNWQHGGQLARSVSKAKPHSGSYSALLGSSGYSCSGVPIGNAWLRRSLIVPSSGSPTLSFWYRIYTQDKNSALSDQYDLFAVYVNGSVEVVRDANTTDSYGCGTLNDLGWKQVNFSLDAYKGQTIQITFYVYNRPDKWYNTYVYVDDVSVQ
jgi:hypothetical protein